MSKEEFEILLKSILSRHPELTQEGISISMGYNEGYISQMLSRGNVSKKFANRMIEKYAVAPSSALKEGETYAYIIRGMAHLSVILGTQAEILAKLTDRSASTVLREKANEVNTVEADMLSQHIVV